MGFSWPRTFQSEQVPAAIFDYWHHSERGGRRLSMPPTFARFNHPYARLVNAKARSDFALCPGCKADCADLIRRELSARVLLPAYYGHAVRMAPRLPPLGHLVCRVVSIGAEKQMGRVDAAGHITAMANVHSVRDGAVRRFPSEAMGRALVATPLQLAVALTTMDGAQPENTAILIRGRAVVRQPLCQGPMARHHKSFSLCSSHDRTPRAKVVRVGVRVDARPNLPFLPCAA